MLLPKIYVLRAVPVIGTIRGGNPAVYCTNCGHRVTEYQHAELVLDEWPDCNLFKSRDGTFFATESLYSQFKEQEIRGYAALEVSRIVSADFWRTYDNPSAVYETIPKIYQIAIIGKCEGPWLRNEKNGKCPICHNDMPRPVEEDFDDIFNEVYGMESKHAILAYANSWDGADIFYMTEPGPPVITERIANMLASNGDLREGEVLSKDLARRVTPIYASKLENQDWKIPICSALGQADWIL